jgi:hypothetical protein
MTRPDWCDEKTWEAAAYAVANAPEYTQRLHEDVARAIMKERERCALIATKYSEIWKRGFPQDHSEARSGAGREIAAAIRGRKA